MTTKYMYKLLKNSGFVASSIILGSAVLALVVLGGLAYKYKNNLAVDKNTLLAGISSIIDAPYQGDGYTIQTFIMGSYGNGSNDLGVMLRLSNTSTVAKTFNFNSGCYYNYLIEDSSGKVIYDFAGGRYCIQSVSSFSVEPNGFKDFQFAVLDAGFLTPGTYKIIGSLSSYGKATTEITIAAPSIKVISPNGGETLQAGTQVIVYWSSQNYPPYAGIDIKMLRKKSSALVEAITLGLYDEYELAVDIVRNAPNVGSGGFGFIIPQEIYPGQYKIEVSCSRNQGYGYGYGQNCVADASNAPFTVVALSSLIKVLAPNGGDVLSAGSTVEIRWESNNVGKVTVHIIPYNAAITLPINEWLAASIPNNGRYEFNIPLNMPDSQYLIQVFGDETLDGRYIKIYDQSDAPFTIKPGGKLTPEQIQAQIVVLMKQIYTLQNQVQTSEVQAQIIALLGQIQSLQAQLTTAPVCDTTAKAIVNSVGGCGTIDQSLYSNIYKACCVKPTKETLLSMLNNALADGVIDTQEKAALLSALDSYLGQ